MLGLSFTAGNAPMEMKMNRAAFQHIGGGASGDLTGIGDEAYVAGGGMLMVRKGNTLARFMYISCPCNTDNIKPLARTVASRKKELAFSLGGMGSATANFYNDAYSRQGWADVAARVRERWQAGDRDGAAGLVTDEMVLATTLIGTEDMVRARLETWREVGVDTVRLYPAGDTLAARLDNLGRGIALVRAL